MHNIVHRQLMYVFGITVHSTSNLISVEFCCKIKLLKPAHYSYALICMRLYVPRVQIVCNRRACKSYLFAEGYGVTHKFVLPCAS